MADAKRTWVVCPIEDCRQTLDKVIYARHLANRHEFSAAKVAGMVAEAGLTDVVVPVQTKTGVPSKSSSMKELKVEAKRLGMKCFNAMTRDELLELTALQRDLNSGKLVDEDSAKRRIREAESGARARMNERFAKMQDKLGEKAEDIERGRLNDPNYRAGT